ncbi:MAG: adenosylcobinamide-GDP ribazoletransferase [Chloroflexi bacterium]|nr:adenosylcobinamide-GDP ribazoletransferase [Chloroflexota bacterium]
MGLFIALRFLTILTVPLRREPDSSEIGRSVVYFPLVGVLLGFLLAGFDRLFGLFLPESLVNIFLIVTMVILTGALHLDGFIDTCDGALIRSKPEHRLGIMADSRVGSFGVIGACCLILAKYLALAAVPDDLRMPALVVMPMLSRWAMVFAIGLFPYARKEGIGVAFKEQASRSRVVVATCVALVLSSMLAGVSGLALAGSISLIVLGVGSFLRSRLNGLSGDTYGAINELSEVLALVLLPVLAGVMSTHFLGPWDVFQF